LPSKSLADFVDVWKNTVRTHQYYEALTLINKVHNVDNLGNEKIMATGHLDLIQEGMQGVCIPDPRTGMIRIICISEYASTPLLTIIHEFGHCVESAIKRTLSIEDDGRVDQAYRTIDERLKETDEYKSLSSKKWGCEITLSFFQSKNSLIREEEERLQRELQYLDYLCSPGELFARSYCQYIISRANRPDLLDSLLFDVDGEQSNRQWNQSVFEDIDRGISSLYDNLFISLGWAK